MSTRVAAIGVLLPLLLAAAIVRADVPAAPAPTDASAGIGAACAPMPALPPGAAGGVGVVVAEVVTGGVAAADEWIELWNAGPGPTDLAGLEVVYVTATGATTERRVAWTTSVVLEAGRRILLANAAGTHAALADATWTNGLAATGGTVALRAIGGPVIDAVGWGSAANAFVEGVPAAAPPPGSSLERRPGGGAGHGIDTGENAADLAIRTDPVPEGLGAPVTPPPSGEPSPSPSTTPGPTTSPSSSPDPTPTLDPGDPPSPGPTATPPPVPSPTGTAAPPTPPPTPTPTPAPLAIADARRLSPGTTVTVTGIVTAEAGQLGSPLLVAVEDASGGIAVRLPATTAGPARGTIVTVRGPLAAPYGQLEIRPGPGAIVELSAAILPAPYDLGAGALGEWLEGRLVALTGTITTPPSGSPGDDLALVVTGAGGTVVPVRADASSGLVPADLPRGAAVRLSGVVGQRATRAGAPDGHRLWLRDAGDLVLLAPTPPPSPTSGPAIPIAEAIRLEGRPVTVTGVVTAPRGLLDGSGRRTVLEDRSGAVELLLPDADPAIRPGLSVRVTGVVGRAWGAPRLRVTALLVLGPGSTTPRPVAAEPGEELEWRLVRVTGRIAAIRRDGDGWEAELESAAGRLRIVALPGSGIPVDRVRPGGWAVVTGIVRRPHPAATDRRWPVLPRTPGDLAIAAGLDEGAPGERRGAPPAGADARPAPTAGGARNTELVELRRLGDLGGRRVRVAGLVTRVDAPVVTIADGSGEGEILLAAAASRLATALRPGDAIELEGVVEDGDPPLLVVADPGDLRLLGAPGPGPGRSDDGGAGRPPARLRSDPVRRIRRGRLPPPGPARRLPGPATPSRAGSSR